MTRCSSIGLRRLQAGELKGAPLAEARRHVEGCERCAAGLRELEAERAALLRDVPFDRFAAGVAEKLVVPQRSWMTRAAPYAAAAALLIGVGAVTLRPTDDGVRSKGGESAELFVQDARGVHALAPGERVADDARIELVLHPAGRAEVAAVLLEPGEASVVYQGKAVQGALPQSFEWTGKGTATLLVIYSDAPVDVARIHAASDVPRGAQALQLPLTR